MIDSAAPLEVGGGVCAHPDAMPTQLVCDAAKISGFEVNAGGGDDHVTIGRTVGVPVTLRGGPGNDHLSGGGGTLGDKLVGGSDDDRLVGGPGPDVLRGEAGSDVVLGGSGENSLSD